MSDDVSNNNSYYYASSFARLHIVCKKRRIRLHLVVLVSH